MRPNYHSIYIPDAVFEKDGWFAFTYHYGGVLYSSEHSYRKYSDAAKAQRQFVEWKNNELIEEAEKHLEMLQREVKAL